MPLPRFLSLPTRSARLNCTFLTSVYLELADRFASQLLTEFHLFPELPEEIRLQVWKEYYDGDERLVEVE